MVEMFEDLNLGQRPKKDYELGREFFEHYR
jgi:hypothetical protein